MIRGISIQTNKKIIQDYFSDFGTIQKLKLFYSKGKVFNGKAKVTYEDPISWDILKKTHKVGGRCILVSEGEIAFSLKKTKTKPKPNKQTLDNLRKIFVGGLPLNVDNEALKEYFEDFGIVEDANIVIHHENLKSRGFGFVIFEDANTIDKVLKCHDDHYIFGKWVSLL